MSHTASDTVVVSIGELLDRVRACIGDASSGSTVSLTVDILSESGERRLLRLAVRPDDSLASLPASPLQPQPCSSPSQHSTAPLHVEQDSAATGTGHNKSRQPQQQGKEEREEELVAMESGMEVEDRQEGAEAVMEDSLASSTSSSMTSAERSSGPLSTDVVETAGASSSIPLPSDENLRRSARKLSAIDRLGYGASVPREIERTASQRKRKEAQAEAAEAVDTTDGQSDACEESDAAWVSPSCSSSSATPQSTPPPLAKHRKKCRFQPTSPANNSEKEGDEEERVTALMTRFEEAYAARDDVSLEQTSKDAILHLRRDVLDGLSAAGSAVLLDSAAYQQCAVQLDHLIATSSALRMLGYYLKGALAAKLKQSHRTRYVHAARTLLRLKSSADITACPAFYEFVQQHCPSVASGVVDVEAWLKEPVFLADIGWSEWRRYLGKRHCWIVSGALQRFNASLVPAQDWMQRGWVEQYVDARLGRGVCATRDIPLPSVKGRHRSFGDAVVADLSIFAQAQALVALDSQPQPRQEGGDRSFTCPSPLPAPASPASPYRFEWNRGKQMLDAEKLWVGCINHLPEKQCNLRLSSNGKLVQVKPIRAGEALTFDYSMSYWVERVTGITWKQWMAAGSVACRKGRAELFERMHRSVLDYTALLSQQWSERFATATSEVDKEKLMLELWQEVVPEEQQQMEEGDG